MEEINNNIPQCFNNFKEVCVLLDCTEIPIEKTKCINCRVLTYSHYYGTNTVKVMVGISHAGLFTFKSKAYGGRASDKFIFEDSGLILKLRPLYG